MSQVDDAAKPAVMFGEKNGSGMMSLSSITNGGIEQPHESEVSAKEDARTEVETGLRADMERDAPEKTKEDANGEAKEEVNKALKEEVKEELKEEVKKETEQETNEETAKPPQGADAAVENEAVNNVSYTAELPPTGVFETPVKKQRSAAHKNGSSHDSKHKRTNQLLIIGAKQHHIKKSDGEPLWRKDIQYEFLKEIFFNEEKVFTDPNNKDPDSEKLNFADLYISMLAHSPKTSKILKDRLLSDKAMSVPVGMVSLLVNVGRMNTTINFVPEMKSQLRTYHSIPCLQQGKDQSGKILQDSPRLKSILKSCCEFKGEVNTFAELVDRMQMTDWHSPNTNVVNLIFMLCSYENLIHSHFDPVLIEEGKNREASDITLKDLNLDKLDLTNSNDCPFNCLFLNFGTTPKSRAQRFLWLLYNYLETNLTKSQILNNPFRDEARPLQIPPLIDIPEGVQYDVDTEPEIEYSQKMLEHRRNFLHSDSAHDGAEIGESLNGHTSNGHTGNGHQAAHAQEHKDTISKTSGSVSIDNGAKKAVSNEPMETVNLDGTESGAFVLSKRSTRNRSRYGTRTVRVTKSEKRKLENGTGCVRELNPEAIYLTMYHEVKTSNRKRRKLNGNVRYLRHLMKNGDIELEEEDLAGATNNGNGSSKNGNKSYTGDFGEFASVCEKMFSAGLANYEDKCLEKNKGLEDVFLLNNAL